MGNNLDNGYVKMKDIFHIIVVCFLIASSIGLLVFTFYPQSREVDNHKDYTFTPFKGVTVHGLDTAKALCEHNPDLEDCDIVMELFTDSDDFFEKEADKQYYDIPAHYDVREYNI